MNSGSLVPFTPACVWVCLCYRLEFLIVMIIIMEWWWYNNKRVEWTTTTTASTSSSCPPGFFILSAHFSSQSSSFMKWWWKQWLINYWEKFACWFGFYCFMVWGRAQDNNQSSIQATQNCCCWVWTWSPFLFLNRANIQYSSLPSGGQATAATTALNPHNGDDMRKWGSFKIAICHGVTQELDTWDEGPRPRQSDTSLLAKHMKPWWWRGMKGKPLWGPNLMMGQGLPK